MIKSIVQIGGVIICVLSTNEIPLKCSKFLFL